MRKSFVRPTPRMDAGAERNSPDLWRGVELGKKRQRSFTAFEGNSVVVDAVDREKRWHGFDSGARKFSGVAEKLLHERVALLVG